MNKTELELKNIILERYGSLKKFSETIKMPWTTLDSILKRGILNSNMANITKIAKELGIDLESLAVGEILPSYDKSVPLTLAMRIDLEAYTEQELEEIYIFAEFIKSRR